MKHLASVKVIIIPFITVLGRRESVGDFVLERCRSWLRMHLILLRTCCSPDHFPNTHASLAAASEKLGLLVSENTIFNNVRWRRIVNSRLAANGASAPCFDTTSRREWLPLLARLSRIHINIVRLSLLKTMPETESFWVCTKSLARQTVTYWFITSLLVMNDDDAFSFQLQKLRWWFQ